MLGELHTNHYVVVRNFQELYAFLERVESEDVFLRIWNDESRNELDDVMNEVTRLLLNFVTSAMTRVACVRNIIKRYYKGKPFFTQYQEEVSRRFRGNALAEFVQGLRNYSTHYALPFAGAKMHYSKDVGLSHYFMLDRETLLNSGVFGATAEESHKGRGYLEQSKGDIVIRDVAWRYFVHAHNFHAWLEAEVSRMHRDELEWLYATNAELQAVLAPIRDRIRRMD